MLTAKDKSRLMEYLSIQRGRESVGYRVVQVQDQRTQYMLVTGRRTRSNQLCYEASRLKGYNNVGDLWENSRVNLFDFFEDYAELDGPLEDVVTAVAKRKRRRS